MALQGFFLPPYAAACFEPTSVELHRDREILKDAQPAELLRRDTINYRFVFDRFLNTGNVTWTFPDACRARIKSFGKLFSASM